MRDHCDICRESVPTDQPIFRGQVYFEEPKYGLGGENVCTLCVPCADKGKVGQYGMRAFVPIDGSHFRYRTPPLDEEHSDPRGCEICDRTMVGPLYKSKYNRRIVKLARYCCEACYRRALRKKRSEEEMTRTRHCLNCGEEYRAKRRNALYCSPRCRVARHRHRAARAKRAILRAAQTG